jgi:hypothetical protein
MRSSTHYDPHHNLLCVMAGCKKGVFHVSDSMLSFHVLFMLIYKLLSSCVGSILICQHKNIVILLQLQTDFCLLFVLALASFQL